MKPRKVLLLQTVLEAFIPVVGFLFWKWDLIFIALFYFVDWLLALILMGVKGKRRLSFKMLSQEKKTLLKHLIISVLLILITVVFFVFAVKTAYPELDVFKRTVEFLTYREMGVPQGLLLVPLLIINGVLMYRQQFLFPARYRTMKMTEISCPFVQQCLLAFAGAALFLGFSFFFPLPPIFVIACLILGASLCRFFLRV